jgi:hypothetical protein
LQSARLFWDVVPFCHAREPGFQPPDLGILIQISLPHGRTSASRRQAVSRDTLHLCNILYRVTMHGHLSDRLDLELIRVPLAALGCHKSWLEDVY